MKFLPFPSLILLAVVAFLVALVLHPRQLTRRYQNQKPKRAFSFWGGFIAGFLLWGIWAFNLYKSNDGILSGKVASILGLPGGSDLSPIVLICVTALIAAGIAAFSALGGNALGAAIKPKRFR